MRKLLWGFLFLGSGVVSASVVPSDQKYQQGYNQVAKYNLSLALSKEKLGQTLRQKQERRLRRLPESPVLKQVEDTIEIKIKELQSRLHSLETKLNHKREEESLVAINQRNLGQAMAGHTKIYPFLGEYRVMVIPVEFADAKMAKPEFFKPGVRGVVPAQDYLFGKHKDSLSSFYRHQSLGRFHLEGNVTSIVTVDKPLSYYGEAVSSGSDAHARELVVDALAELQTQITDHSWWDEFDRWDLSDYDKDGNFHEPDGFIDAVIFVYAGKSQAACQRSFDPEGTRPATRDVPAGPRQAAAQECFNRIWPHRWSISLSPEDPRYNEVGPVVEGNTRPSMNGLKIHEGLYALDYNMQSEFSDRSTFMHEFGHSLSLPDVYSSGKDNSTGQWELMSGNAHLQGQELSSYSKLALGWLSPKVVVQGEKTSAYLGAFNFVSTKEREDSERYRGPRKIQEVVDGKSFDVSIVSKVPEYGEAVYRSLAILPKPESVTRNVVTPGSEHGNYLAYSGLFDGELRAMKFKIQVPQTGNQSLSFDTLYAIETETNFDSTDPSDSQVKVTVDYDLGRVLVDGELLEELRLISGDKDFDTLAEENALCDSKRVLELRGKRLQGPLTPAEVEEMKKLLPPCRTPQWVKKTYDLKKFAGQTVELEIHLQTDAGYNEKGLLVDNIQWDGQKIDFESGDQDEAQDFTLLKSGSYQQFFHQFYLMEYRTPGESYTQGKKDLSYNMDNHIGEGTQAMFMGQGRSLDRFRLVTYDYRPGVLVWYYNAKFGRTANDAAAQKGKGYLLVLNSKVGELKLPGILGSPELLDGSGVYRREEAVYKDFVTEQKKEFVCFSHTDYATYLEGVAPDCQGRTDINLMPTLKLAGKNLIYRRINFNELLPLEQAKNVEVGDPMRNSAYLRTGLSPFAPEGSAPFAPFKVYKAQGSDLVLDPELTAAAPVFASVSEFRDADNQFSTLPEFQGDSVTVEKRGLKFKVAAPSSRILGQYKTAAHADDSANFLRRPRAKIYIDWE